MHWTRCMLVHGPALSLLGRELRLPKIKEAHPVIVANIMSFLGSRNLAASTLKNARLSSGALRSAPAAVRLFSQSTPASVSFELNEDQQAYQDLARKFTRENIVPVARHYDETMEYPWEVIKKAHELV